MVNNKVLLEVAASFFEKHRLVEGFVDVQGRIGYESLRTGERLYILPELYLWIPLGSGEHVDIWRITDDGFVYEGTEEGYRTPPEWLLEALMRE